MIKRFLTTAVLSFLMFISGCVVYIGDLSLDEVSKLINLRGEGFNRYNALFYESTDRLQYALYRSDSLSDLRKQLLFLPTAGKWPAASAANNVQMLNESVNELKTPFVDGCPVDPKKGYNKHPYPYPYTKGATNTTDPNFGKYKLDGSHCDVSGKRIGSLYNDNTYYYVLAVRDKKTQGDPSKGGVVFYSNITAITPHPRKLPQSNVVNSGLGNRSQVSAAGSEAILISNAQDNFPVIQPTDGLVEYNLYYSNVPRLTGAKCDYVSSATCNAVDYTGGATKLDRGFLQDLANHHGIKPREIYLSLYNNPVVQRNNQKLYGTPIPTEATPEVGMPLYLTMEAVNSFGSTSEKKGNDQEVKIERFKNVALKADDEKLHIFFTNNETPTLTVWATDSQKPIEIEPSGYLVSLVHDTKANDLPKLFSPPLDTEIATKAYFLKGQPITFPNLINGDDYWIQVSAEYDISSPPTSTAGATYTTKKLYRLSNILKGKPLGKPKPIKLWVAFDDWKESSLQKTPKRSLVLQPSYLFQSKGDPATTYFAYRATSASCLMKEPPKCTAAENFKDYDVSLFSTNSSTATLPNILDISYASQDSAHTTFPPTPLSDNTREFYTAVASATLATVYATEAATLQRFVLKEAPLIETEAATYFEITFDSQFTSVLYDKGTLPRYHMLIWGGLHPDPVLEGDVYKINSVLDTAGAVDVDLAQKTTFHAEGLLRAGTAKPGMGGAPSILIEKGGTYYIKLIGIKNIDADVEDEFAVSKIYKIRIVPRPKAPKTDIYWSQFTEPVSGRQKVYVVFDIEPQEQLATSYYYPFISHKEPFKSIADPRVSCDFSSGLGITNVATAQAPIIAKEFKKEISRNCSVGVDAAVDGRNFELLKDSSPPYHPWDKATISVEASPQYLQVGVRGSEAAVQSRSATLQRFPLETHASSSEISLNWATPEVSVPLVDLNLDFKEYQIYFATKMTPTSIDRHLLKSTHLVSHSIDTASLTDGITYEVKVVATYEATSKVGAAKKQLYRLSKLKEVTFIKPPVFDKDRAKNGMMVIERYYKTADTMGPAYPKNEAYFNQKNDAKFTAQYFVPWISKTSLKKPLTYQLFLSTKPSTGDKPSTTFATVTLLSNKLPPPPDVPQQNIITFSGTQLSKIVYGTLFVELDINGDHVAYVSDSASIMLPPQEPSINSITTPASLGILSIASPATAKGKREVQFYWEQPIEEKPLQYSYHLLVNENPWSTVGSTCQIFDASPTTGCGESATYNLGNPPATNTSPFYRSPPSGHTVFDPSIVKTHGLCIGNQCNIPLFHYQIDPLVFDNYFYITPVSAIPSTVSSALAYYNGPGETRTGTVMVTQAMAASSFNHAGPGGKAIPQTLVPNVIPNLLLPGSTGATIDFPQPSVASQCKPLVVNWVFYDESLNPDCDYRAISLLPDKNLPTTAQGDCYSLGFKELGGASAPLSLKYPATVTNHIGVVYAMTVYQDSCGGANNPIVGHPVALYPKSPTSPTLKGKGLPPDNAQELTTHSATTDLGPLQQTLYRFPVVGGTATVPDPRDLYLKTLNGLGTEVDGICNYLVSRPVGSPYNPPATEDPDCIPFVVKKFSMIPGETTVATDTFPGTADYIVSSFNPSNGGDGIATSSNPVRMTPYTKFVTPDVEFSMTKVATSTDKNPIYTLQASPGSLPNAPVNNPTDGSYDKFVYRWRLLDTSNSASPVAGCNNPIASYSGSPKFSLGTCSIVTPTTYPSGNAKNINKDLNGGVSAPFNPHSVFSSRVLPQEILAASPVFYIALEYTRMSDGLVFYATPVMGRMPPFFAPDMLSAGEDHACVLANDDEGHVYCWGGDQEYQLANTFPDNKINSYQDAHYVLRKDGKPLQFVLEVSSGGKFSCAIVDPNPHDATDKNQVYCWGKNSEKDSAVQKVMGVSGALTGDNVKLAHLVSDSILPENNSTKGQYNPIHIASGYASTCLIYKNESSAGAHDKVRCFGADIDGEVSVDLGYGKCLSKAGVPGANSFPRSCGLDVLLNPTNDPSYEPSSLNLNISQSLPKACVIIKTNTKGSSLKCWGSHRTRSSGNAGSNSEYFFTGSGNAAASGMTDMNSAQGNGDPDEVLTAGNFTTPSNIAIGDTFGCVVLDSKGQTKNKKELAYPDNPAGGGKTVVLNKEFSGDSVRCFGQGGANGAFRLGFRPIGDGSLGDKTIESTDPWRICGFTGITDSSSIEAFKASDLCTVSFLPGIYNRNKFTYSNAFTGFIVDRIPSFYLPTYPSIQVGTTTVQPKREFIDSGYQFDIPKDIKIVDAQSGLTHTCIRFEGNFNSSSDPSMQSVACWGATNEQRHGGNNPYSMISPAFVSEESLKAMAPGVNPFGAWLSLDSITSYGAVNGDSDNLQTVYEPYLLRDDSFIPKTPGGNPLVGGGTPKFATKQFTDVVAIGVGQYFTCYARYNGKVGCIGDLSFGLSGPPTTWSYIHWNLITFHH